LKRGDKKEIEKRSKREKIDENEIEKRKRNEKERLKKSLEFRTLYI